jgi:hypothetical protein
MRRQEEPGDCARSLDEIAEGRRRDVLTVTIHNEPLSIFLHVPVCLWIGNRQTIKEDIVEQGAHGNFIARLKPIPFAEIGARLETDSLQVGEKLGGNSCTQVPASYFPAFFSSCLAFF